MIFVSKYYPVQLISLHNNSAVLILAKKLENINIRFYHEDCVANGLIILKNPGKYSNRMDKNTYL